MLKSIDHAKKFNPVSAVGAGVGAVGSGVGAGVGAVTKGLSEAERLAVGGILQQDGGKAAVHTFDPDASPADKAKLAGFGKGMLGAVPGAGMAAGALGSIPGAGAVKKASDAVTGRTVDIDTSTKASAPKPTVSVQDIDRVSRAEGQVPGGDSVPGAIPTGAAPPVPTWLQIGWKQNALGDPNGDIAHQQASILEDYLKENMYGAWFHNAGIILFAVLVTRFLTVLRFGWGWIILVLATCASIYNLSISRTRRRARDDIQRELVKTRLVTETESVDWLNSFLDRFWLIYEPVLSQTIVASVDSVLEAQTPPFLESIRLTTFTLGTKAPRVDHVRTFPKTPEDIVIMDWAISFTPNDLEDLTPRQAANRVNPKIVLSIRLGKGFVSTAMPILLEDMSFSGHMRIKLKLMTNFPHVQTVDISFLEKPTFDYVLKPIGGETLGFDINSIPGLAPFIRDQVHANLGPMMYDPNVFTIDLEALMSGTPLDSAIGVLKINVIDARGLNSVKLGGGAPDPYVSLALGDKPALGKTKTIDSTSSPTWNETKFVLINSLADILNLSLWDYNEHRPDNLLGTVTQELSALQEDAEQEGIVGKILEGGKERGQLRYDMSYYPVLQPEKAADGTVSPPPDSNTGIVRFTIHQAKDLDVTGSHGELNTFAKVFLGGSKTPVHTTPTIKKSKTPIWESHTEFLVPDKSNSVISVKVIDDNKLASDATLGTLSIKLTDLLAAKERQQDWLPLSGSRGGKIRVTTEWKPVGMAGALDGAASYTAPIGILRVWLKNAVDVKNVEAALGGKSDPYVRVMSNSKVLARTEVQNNNLNPEWDQIVYVPVHSTREHILLEVMDYQNIGKDRSLGYVEIAAGDYITPVEDNVEWPYASTGAQTRSDAIKLGKGNAVKGKLNYEVDFKPAISLRGGVSFDAQKNDFELAAEQKVASGATKTPAPTNGSSTAVSASGAPVAASPAPATNGNAAAAAAAAATPANIAKAAAPPTEAPGTGIPTLGAVTGAPADENAPAAVAPAAGKATTTATAAAASPAGAAATDDKEVTATENPEKGVVLSDADLLTFQSGVLVFQAISGVLPRKGALEVMFDDGYWPSFTSTRARTNRPTWDQIGEGFVRELDFSRIWLRINADEDEGDEDIVAEYKCDTREFLETCLKGPADFTLSLADGSNRTTIRMAARYVPVKITLEQRETINNMGVLRVDAVGAKGLAGADRSGKSDPYAIFTLNGQKVFKTETKKKTLTPVWNESFEAMIPSRVAAKFVVDIMDWDRVGTATPIGHGVIDVNALEPFQAAEIEVPVTHPKQGPHGSITLRLLFQPEIIARTRQKTSLTFSSAGRALTTVGGAPIAVGKGVVHGGTAVVGGVGSGIGAVGGFAGRRMGLMKKKDKSGKEVLVPVDANGASSSGYEVPAGQVSQPVDAEATGVPAGSAATTLPPGMGASPGEPGTLAVTVLNAKDLKGKDGAKPYVALKLGGKSHKTDHVKGLAPEWNESFSFNVAPGQSALTVTVFEHHSFGKDIELGEAEVDIWRHIQPAVPNADVWVELNNGSGLLRLRLDWDSAANATSNRSFAGKGRTPSISSKSMTSSPSRFSLGPLTPKKNRESTPLTS